MQNFIKNNLNFLNQDWLVIADGEALSKNKLEKLSLNRKILVLDGAYKIIKKYGWSSEYFDFLLGDFDSVDLLDLENLKINHPEKIIHTPDQDKTDLDKGLEFVFNFKPRSILITGALGLRLQHGLYNLRILKKYFNYLNQGVELSLVSEREQINYYENREIIITGEVGQSIGILGFPKGVVSSDGLKYELENYELNFEKNNSVCNRFLKNKIKLKMTGSVLVILEFEDEES